MHLLAAAIPWQTIATIIGLLLGGGGLVAFFSVRSTNVKLRAEGIKATAEGQVMLNDAVQSGYDKLLDSLTKRLDEATGRIAICEAARAQGSADLEAMRSDNARTKIKLAEVEAQVLIARAAVVELQDRLDRAEDEHAHAEPKPKRTPSTTDAVRKSVGVRKK